MQHGLKASYLAQGTFTAVIISYKDLCVESSVSSQLHLPLLSPLFALLHLHKPPDSPSNSLCTLHLQTLHLLSFLLGMLFLQMLKGLPASLHAASASVSPYYRALYSIKNHHDKSLPQLMPASTRSLTCLVSISSTFAPPQRITYLFISFLVSP